MSFGLTGLQNSLNENVRNYFGLKGDRLNRDVKLEKGSYYQEHFTISQKTISKIIKGCKDTALILGAGGANDLPLQDLADQFEKIVLVDADLKHTQEAVKSLPEELQSKFSLEQADLTGYFNSIDTEFEAIAKENLPFEVFISRVAQLLPQLVRQEFDYQKMNASFVCSSLVCSQLMGGVINYLKGYCKKLYGKELTNSGEFTKLLEDLSDWLVQIQINHLRDLHRLVEPLGKIYFADHFSTKGYVVATSEIEVRPFFLGEREFPGVQKIQEEIEKLFSTTVKKEWGWALPINRSIQPSLVVEEDGSTTEIPTLFEEFQEYEITALNLVPKYTAHG